MKTLFDYMNEASMPEMRQIDNRNFFGTDDEMMVVQEVRNLAEKIAATRNIDKRDALYLIKKVIDKVIR